jgi:Ferredoxin subunits of nitrite reductase and ring-hydroxylating dioxygenases
MSDNTNDETPSDDRFTRVGATDELEQGKGMGVEIDGIEVAVFNVNGEFHATSNRCPHQRAPLCKVGEKKINGEKCWNENRGGVTDQPTVTCPWHVWEIDLETGEHEASGKRIGVFDVKVEDGDILVGI